MQGACVEKTQQQSLSLMTSFSIPMTLDRRDTKIRFPMGTPTHFRPFTVLIRTVSENKAAE
jgi:hypothetical protein